VTDLNLYDKDDGFKRFTIDEANALLPEIIAATEEAATSLETLKHQVQTEKLINPNFAEEQFEQEALDVLQYWSEQMVELGVYPKGYFTVDFKSIVPDTLLCWTYGENEIGHTHKINESFKDRIPIRNRKLLGFEDSVN
jgi:hypothetical protein